MENQESIFLFYLATLRTADAVGMAVVKKDDLARMLAIVYNEGGNEQFAYSYKLRAEM